MTSIGNSPRTHEERHQVADAITEAMRLIENEVLLRVAANRRDDIERAARSAREGVGSLGDDGEKAQKACKAVDALIDSCEDYKACLSQSGGTTWGIRAARRMLQNTLRLDKALREM